MEPPTPLNFIPPLGPRLGKNYFESERAASRRPIGYRSVTGLATAVPNGRVGRPVRVVSLASAQGLEGSIRARSSLAKNPDAASHALPNQVFWEAVSNQMLVKYLKSLVPPPRLERGTSRSTISWTEIYDRFCSSLEAPKLLANSWFSRTLAFHSFPVVSFLWRFGGDLSGSLRW